MLQELVKAIEDVVSSMLNGIHTAMPAEIVEFNPDDCTATVLPKAKSVLADGRVIDYPPINDVPVMFQQGSGRNVAMAFPVEKGDGCLLIICEQALDFWRGEGENFSEMKYSLSNAIAIPGLFRNSTSEVREAIRTNSVILKNGPTKIAISDSGVFIKGDVEIDGNVIYTGRLTYSGPEDGGDSSES